VRESGKNAYFVPSYEYPEQFDALIEICQTGGKKSKAKDAGKAK
jgi:hypothetical protein